MKRFLIAILILTASLSAAGDSISKSRLTATISDCRRYQGAEIIKLGRISTGAIKGMLRLISLSEPEAMELVHMMKGVTGLTVFDYSDCSERDIRAIDARLDNIFEGKEVLMEVSDDEDRLIAFGVVDDNSEWLRDFVLYVPSDCTLICVFGSIPVEKMIHIVDND